jgi:predicted AAA+ superfamily ATPase
VFVFENEANLNSFLNLPRKYLTQLPKLPKNTNIFITGPRKSGKKTIANMLGSLYNLKVINIQEILEKVLLRQRQFESHIPSNFDKRSSSIHLS